MLKFIQTQRRILIFNLTFTILLLINLNIPQATADATNSQQFPDQQQSPNPQQIINDNSSIPFLEMDKDKVELGNKLSIFYGMRDDQDQFISGYNFSLYIKKGLFSNTTIGIFDPTVDLLVTNGTTQNFLETVTFGTIRDDSLFVLKPSFYTLILLVNSTIRGPLNATHPFEIIVQPGAEINVSFSDALTNLPIPSALNLQINEVRIISLSLINVGLSNAFNISLGISGINEPLGLANTTLPLSIDVLNSFERKILNFSVFPDKFGIGKIQFDLQYSDGAGDNKLSAPVFKIIVLPEIRGSVEIQNNVIQLDEDNKLEVSIKVEYHDDFDLSPLIITLSLFSTNINFIPTAIPYNRLASSYFFSGISVESGLTVITLSISYFDPIGTDEEIVVLEELIIQLIPFSPVDPRTTFIRYLPIMSILLYFFFVIFILLLYFRKDFRVKFFSRILGTQMIEEIKYQTNKIIIDGSNVAWENPNKRGKPQISNIILLKELLEEKGFDDIMIIADAALRYQIEDKTELDNYVKNNIIKLVPAKVDADGFILRLAAEGGYMILTNDLFKEFRNQYGWIDERRIPYTIFNNKVYLHPTFQKN